VDYQVGKVEISLYGKEETHDALVQIPGAFARSVEAGRVLRRGGITVVIKCPLMNLNIKDYPFLVALAESEGFLFKFDPTVVPRDDKDTEPLALRTYDEELKAAFRDPKLRLSAAGDSPEDYVLATPVCDAGRTYLSIGPNGDVYPCLEWRTVLGNLRQTPLSEIWNSPYSRKIGNLTREDFPVCNSCELLPWCPRCTGLADREDGDPFGPAREACHLAKLNYEVVTGLKAPLTNLEKTTNQVLPDRPSVSGCGSGKCGGCATRHPDTLQATRPSKVIPISVRP
jgi:radical SAM protein with 4Fe4S-binding SPASM domain